MNKICSVLIPSRKRYEYLYASVEKLINTASNPENIEILIRIDNDDKDTISKIATFPKDWNIMWVVGNRYDGYKDLHIMFDELCRLSTGEFYWLWNDDVIVKSDGWDDVLREFINKLCVIRTMHRTWTDGYEVPIVSKMIYNITGHFSLFTYNDDYIHHLIEEIKKEYFNFDIRINDKSKLYVEHNHGLPREHELDGMESQYPPASLIEMKELKNDAQKILLWLEKNPSWKIQ